MVLVCMTNKTADCIISPNGDFGKGYKAKWYKGKRGNIFELCDKFGVNNTTIYKILNCK